MENTNGIIAQAKDISIALSGPPLLLRREIDRGRLGRWICRGEIYIRLRQDVWKKHNER